VAADLSTFCSVFGWPSANLEVHKMSQTIFPNAGWALESDLDVQWAHAVAPHANLLLVEAKSNSIVDLMAAVDYANARSDVVAISMSWGSNENTGQLAYDSHFATNGKTYFASSGDVGGVVSWPSSSPNVISVGGTKLTMTTTGYTETAWSNGGGGVSSIEPIPDYQKGVTASYSLSNRATPDVSYNADPSTGFLVYDSYGYNGGRGWFIVGGTSAGAPQWAAICTFGNSATNVNFYANYPNRYGTTFSDVVGGSNGYTAASGYDLATGIGSPIGTDFAAPTIPDFAISAAPSALSINAGFSKTTSVTVTAMGTFSESVTLSASSTDGSNNWLTLPANSIATPYAAATLTINVPSDAAIGTQHTITITGTSASQTHSTTITVTVTNPDFSLTVNPTSLNIIQGSYGRATVALTALNDFTSSVTLSTTSAPTGWTTTITPKSITPTTSAQLIITVPQNTLAKSYTITVQGTRGTITKTVTLTVNVINPNFGLSACPTSLTIRQGRIATSRISITPINNYPASVTLASTGAPTGMTTSFSKNPVSAGSYATMTINVARTTATGTYILSITGTDTTGVSHIATVKVTVTR
jgi:hypothetical protein